MIIRRSVHMRTLISADGRTHHISEVDRDGNPIGPTRLATAEPETIPNGLSALPERISRFVVAPAAKSALHIFALDHDRGCALSRFGGPMTFSAPCPDESHAQRRRDIHDLFARHGIAPLVDALGARAAILRYPLPDSAERIASLCMEALASCCGIAEDEPLLFTVIHYP